MPPEGLSFVKTLLKFGKIYATDPLLKNTTNIACLSSLTLDIFNLKVNPRSSSSGNDEISSSSRQFFFDCKVVRSALDNLLVGGSEIIYRLIT